MVPGDGCASHQNLFFPAVLLERRGPPDTEAFLVSGLDSFPARRPCRNRPYRTYQHVCPLSRRAAWPIVTYRRWFRHYLRPMALPRPPVDMVTGLELHNHIDVQ